MNKETGSPEREINIPRNIPGFRWPYRVLHASSRIRRNQSTIILIFILIFLGVAIAVVVTAIVFLIGIVLDSIV